MVAGRRREAEAGRESSTEAPRWMSRAVVAAFEAPENAGKGALRVEGRLAEHLHRDEARLLIAVADAIAQAEAG